MVSPTPHGPGPVPVGSGGTTPSQPPAQELNVVKISLCLPGMSGSGQLGAATTNDKTRVIFELSIRGELTARLEAGAEELRLPLTIEQARSAQRTEDKYEIPSYVLAALEAVVLQDGWPLWISFPRYSGYLPVLPWEPLLKARLNVPVLRLSYTDVQPIRSRSSLDAVLCFSFPKAKELIAEQSADYQTPETTVQYFLSRIPANLASYTTIHIFADLSLYRTLISIRDNNPAFHIIVYDPNEAAKYAAPAADPQLVEASNENLESPWLLWMRDSLGSRSVDEVHFVCHGYLGKEQGFLAVSHSPLLNDDEAWSRFIGARQLCTFLDQTGAWSVAFSSMRGNYSISGLRMLQDQIARIRPGPVLFHDMARDPDKTGWDQAYQFAYALEDAQAPMSDAVSLCCHPAWALPGTQPDSRTQQLLKELTVAGQMLDVFEGRENTPSWLASGQRALERSVAQLLSTSSGDPETILSGGSAKALQFASKLLQQHAAKFARDVKK
jgi:hypothetical protein